jgi:O-antigen/teichoic acid export membrane protein
VRLSFVGLVERWAPQSLRPRLVRFATIGDSILTGRDDRAVAQRMALIAFSIRIVSAVIAYLSQVLLARWMGEFEYGIYVVVWVGAVIIGGLACLGIQTAVVRFVPEYAARNEMALLRGIVVGSRAHGLATATLIAAIGLVGIALFRDQIASYYVMPLYLAAICVPMLAIGEIQDGLARGFNWADLALGPTFLIRPILIILFTFLALEMGAVADATTAMTTAILATYVTSLLQMAALAYRTRKVVPPGIRQYRSMTWLTVAFPIFLVEGFFNLLTNVDILIVGQLRAPEEVAVYFAAVKTLALVHFVYFAVRAATMQRFSQYYASGDRVRFEATVRDSLHWTFWPSVAAVLVLFVFGRFLLSMFGENFVSGFPLIFVFSAGLLIRASIGPAESILTMAGEQRICAAVYAVTFLVNLILNYTLIPHFGLMGAAVATSLALVLETLAVYLAVRWRLKLKCSILHVLGPRGSIALVNRKDEQP